ncbi:DMT family transporter [Tepidibacter aestuarii]|uniref:DMT family transporter n=1 Tax=Tepidibacter aestuarii TaxID=2925782 RepID=UPI0020BF710A|nr:DMT family transporter [Tepidibacter aestuarii]CAH2215418.1 bacterial/archaeal transporter family-2 protein [Tepidibacter aestuarii]
MIYILLSFLAGITIVINMMLNGKLAKREGMINGVIINYLMGIISSIILCGIMMESIPSFLNIKSIPLPYFIGGFIGVLTTYMSNIIVPKIPAVYIVILRFIGQILTSAIIDYIYLDIFSKGKVIGGAIFLIGLILNAKADNNYELGNLRLS